MHNAPPSEPLRPATSEEIAQLLRVYEQLLPECVQFVSLLQNIVRVNATLRGAALQAASHRFRKTVYVPERPNATQFATFLAISMDEDIHIMVNSLEQPPDELENAIRHSRYIKWHLKPLFVIGGDNGIRESLYKVASERSTTLNVTSDCINYWMPRDEAATVTYAVPDDVELKPLQVEHAKTIDAWWPFQYPTSQLMFETAIKHGGGLGLFDKTDGQQVACVCKNDHDGIGHLHVVPERNNRGYGTTLAKAMTRLIAGEHKQHVHAFIGRTNSRSMRLFEKIGFVPISQTEWHGVDW